MLEELWWEQQAELLEVKYNTMQRKLFIAGRNIMVHTNEQQKILELQRQEIGKKKKFECNLQQEMVLRYEKTIYALGHQHALAAGDGSQIQETQAALSSCSQ
ncbi:Kinesin-like protein KIF3C [Galemys pyrenaicus]|uniref:Kinesin-like protein KIF3C n=1 Tax=Galemys pyrenaicus TaxID=202257 RepID=A0A8J6A6Z2_GALPY|nr:Kinesin-like protein KIF3C [Galemys pyrenaicus]